MHGKWLKKGAHLDLVGAYTPKMREADDDCVKRARVYVDTRAGAPKEAGDIAQPLKSGVLKKDGIRGDLFELCRGKAKGRTGERRSRCSSRSGRRSRIWRPRCWCGGAFRPELDSAAKAR